MDCRLVNNARFLLIIFSVFQLSACFDDRNKAPVADDLTITVNQNETKSLKRSDLDDDGNISSYVIKTQPSHGALGGTAPNLVYTLNLNYTGIDQFTFSVIDNNFYRIN